ncbi:hypothetical protein N665_3046s0001 [Sinapis alba]|nr:hypothetical protein N665_3046s0001 [Sinapis alba]
MKSWVIRCLIKIMDIYVYNLRFSGRVVYTFVCKQLLTAKLHELWFYFARRPLRFSMQEFYAITGLKYEDEPDMEIDKWRDDKGLRLVYLCVIAGMVMVKDEKVWISHKYIKLMMDFDKMKKYPWGFHSFDALVTSVITARNKVKTQNNYVKDGFSYALQIWLMEAIPDTGSLLDKKLREGVTSMRCRN